MNEKPETKTQILAEGRFLRMVARSGWEWVERVNTTGAVIIVAVTDSGELVLTEQHRIPLSARVVELPAGLAGDAAGTEHEALAEAARRELLEETGFEADRMEFLTEGPSSAGLSTEVYTMFLARHARRVAQGGGDEAEDIEVHVVPLANIHAWLEQRRQHGALVDPRIYAGLHFVHERTGGRQG